MSCRGFTLRGFTLIELLVVVTILSILTAIVLPVLATVKRSASERACISNFRQIYTALQIYAADHGGLDGEGAPWEMGLPLWFSQGGTRPLPDGILHCNSRQAASLHGYTQAWPTPEMSDQIPEALERWKRYAQMVDGDVVLMMDVNHNDMSPYSPMATHLGIGLYRDGSVRMIRQQGYPHLLPWWNKLGNPPGLATGY